MEMLREAIRDIPDFPKPGIVFKDITPLLQTPDLFKRAIAELAKQVQGWDNNCVVAIESRGFIFGSALAYELGVGLSLVRKPGKLPYKTRRVEYALEYGTDALEMHVDTVHSGSRVLIVDDVLATGGTARATTQLVESMGAKLNGYAFLTELSFLNGRKQLPNYPIRSLLLY